MRDHPDESVLLGRIDAAAAKTRAWLRMLQIRDAPAGVVRISAAHDVARWPGLALPATYNAVMCADLLDGLADFSADDRRALADWLEAHRRDDGVFRVPGMLDADVFKKADAGETWTYLDFHVGNYSLGAVQALDPSRVPNLRFAERFLDPLVLKAWLAERDLREPWLEGNNIVNLGSFFLAMAAHGDAEMRARVDAAMRILFDWHDRLQDPDTGFWGVGQSGDPTRLLHAFAGSMHNYHLWYECGRPLPYHARAVDYVLTRPTQIHSACIDVDEIDVLAHADRLIEHRREEARRWLAAKLVSLLDFQNDDGGFADETSGVRRQDGWVRGYEEPQGLSNTFATWFRWIAIALAADRLWPGQRKWRFRRMVGIGYRMPDRS